jgi:propionyl-CoA synthetase
LAEAENVKTIIFQRKEKIVELVEGRDYDYEELMKNAKPVDAVPVESTHPLYILYTSG